MKYRFDPILMASRIGTNPLDLEYEVCGPLGSSNLTTESTEDPLPLTYSRQATADHDLALCNRLEASSKLPVEMACLGVCLQGFVDHAGRGVCL